MTLSACATNLDGCRLEIEPLVGALGATAWGVDLRKPLSLWQISRLHDAVRDHLVVFLRDQPLTDAQHIAFAAQLGEPLAHPITALRGEPGLVTVVRNDATRRPSNAAWHSDLSWLEQPPALAVLRAIRIPKEGGDTIWSNMYAAWEGFSDAERRRFAPLDAVHDFDGAVGPRVRRIDGRGAHRRLREALPPVAHPIARANPETGRSALFVNEAFTSGVARKTAEESAAVLEQLFAHIRRPEWQVRHRWREGDVVVWDERVTQHFACADHYPAEREVRRVTLVGERPVRER